MSGALPSVPRMEANETPGGSEPPVRVCRKCSAQASVEGTHCPHCGAAYAGRRKPSGKTVAIAVAAVVVVGGATAGGLALKSHHDHVQAQHAADVRLAAQQRAAARKQAAVRRERAKRRQLVRFLQRNITKSARKAADDGVLDGPIKYSSCTPTGGGSVDNLTSLSGTFDCIAVNKENNDGTVSGYTYSGTIDWNTGSASWQLGG